MATAREFFENQTLMQQFIFLKDMFRFAEAYQKSETKEIIIDDEVNGLNDSDTNESKEFDL